MRRQSHNSSNEVFSKKSHLRTAKYFTTSLRVISPLFGNGRITILNDGKVVAEDSPEGLKTLIRDRVDGPATLEDVFMTYTGRSLDDDIEEDDAEDD